jgi:EpsD family peptidyl-prolyl cis-trans isomerase
MHSSRIRLSAAGLVAVLLAGCMGREEPGAKTQVAARVNGDEITVHQVKLVLESEPGFGALDEAAAKRHALERLIDRQLARQQSVALKLDRQPAVMQSIEAARSRILARAYLQHIAASQADPAAEQIRGYYAENRALFAERRVFELEEIVVQAPSGLAERLRPVVARAKSMPEVAAWLRSQQLAFNEHRGTRAAEQVPLALLPALRAMAPNELRLVEQPHQVSVFRLLAARHEPVDEISAAPRIREVLVNQRFDAVLGQTMDQLRRQSRIEYAVEFAAAAAQPATLTARGEP